MEDINAATTVTEAGNAEVARTESDNQFRALFDNAPLGIVVVDMDRRIINCNLAFQKMIGYTLAELTQLSVPEISNQEDDSANRELYRALIDGKIENFSMHKRYVRKDGTILWTNLTGAAIRDNDRTTAFFGIIEDITERKKEAEALQESQTRLREIFEQSNDGITMLDFDGRFLMVNPVFCAMTGYSREELLNMRVYDLVPDHVSLELFPQVAEQRKSGRRETELLRKDGSLFFASISGSAFKVGSKEYALGIVQDITDRMRVAQALRESETQYRTLFEQSPYGVLLINDHGAIVDFNDRACSQLGYTREEFRNIRLLDVDPTVTREEIATRQKRVAQLGKAEFDVKHKTKNGAIRDVHVITQRIHLGGKTFFHAIWRDITEQKVAERELRESIKRAEEERARAEAIIAAMGDGLSIRGRDYRIVYQNDASKQMTGDHVGEFCYNAFRHVDRVCDECPVEKSFNDGEIHVCELSVPGDKGLRYFENVASPIRDANGEIIAGIEISRETTKSRRIQEQLETLNTTLSERVAEETEKNRIKDQVLQLQSRQAAMGEMINNIAHQWRQPLNNLGLTIQGLQSKFDNGMLTSEVLRDKVRLSMSLINYMSQTINDFTNFFRQDKSIMKFRVREVVKTALGFMETSFKRNAVTLIVDVPDDIIVSGYKNEYTQVVVNILTNARDVLIERQAPKPTISLRAFRDNGRSVLTIADNGGGIPDSIRENVFRPFFTTKGDGKGTGIGLYISKNIIENNMKGNLSAANTDEGALFRIEVQD